MTVRRGDKVVGGSSRLASRSRSSMRWSCRCSRSSASGTSAVCSSCGWPRPRPGAGSAVAAAGSFAVLGFAVRDPHGVPAARAGEPITAALATPARRDARHVPPLADGRQPGGARCRGDRGGPTADPRRGLLPRRRQAGEPAGVHREPGGRRERARSSSTPRRARRSSSSTSPTASTLPTRRGCRSR